jgi:hypothetical protein
MSVRLWKVLNTSTSASFELKCSRGEGAVLNVETGSAKYTFCDKYSKKSLGKYMEENYRKWMVENEYEDFLRVDELFLVTGTYMTQNWEPGAFQARSDSYDAEMSVGAMTLANSQVIIKLADRTPLNCTQLLVSKLATPILVIIYRVLALPLHSLLVVGVTAIEII